MVQPRLHIVNGPSFRIYTPIYIALEPRVVLERKRCIRFVVHGAAGGAGNDFAVAAELDAFAPMI